jgi:cell wall-associated NlpC family hydrolase
MGLSIMRPLFATPEQQERFLKEVQSWEGTPYRRMAVAKGRGCDCSLLLGGVLKDLGILTQVKYNPYGETWHIHSKKELIIEGLLEHADNYMVDGYAIKEMPKDVELMIGDIMLFWTTMKMTASHAAFYVGEWGLFNCIQQVGACYIDYRRPWPRALKSVYRVMEI